MGPNRGCFPTNLRIGTLPVRGWNAGADGTARGHSVRAFVTFVAFCSAFSERICVGGRLGLEGGAAARPLGPELRYLRCLLFTIYRAGICRWWRAFSGLCSTIRKRAKMPNDEQKHDGGAITVPALRRPLRGKAN
jgi:hypothetical protein